MLYLVDRFLGYVKMGGYSPNFNSGGTFTFSLPVVAGSTTRRALLFAGRHGNAVPITVILNGLPYTFDNSNQVSPTFQSPTYGGNAGVHAIDITSDINAATNSFTITIPFQPGPSNRYADFSLYIACDNFSLPVVDVLIDVNEYDLNLFGTTQGVTNNLSFPIPISNTSPVGLSFMTGFDCDCSVDGWTVRVNNTNLGTIGSPNPGFGTCGGPLGSFSFISNVLAGLQGNAAVPNASMGCNNVLADVSSIVANNATAFSTRLKTTTSGNPTNAVWATFVVYTDTLPDTCPTIGPMNLNTSNITQNSAQANWTAPLIPFDSFEVRYRTVGSQNWSTLTTTLTNIVNIIDYISTPPVSPASGDGYIVAPGGTGVWAGQDNKIARWNGAAYVFTAPTTFSFALLTASPSSTIMTWNGTSWVTPFPQLFQAITGLNNNTAYEWQVIFKQGGIICGAAAYSSIEPFTTLP